MSRCRHGDLSTGADTRRTVLQIGAKGRLLVSGFIAFHVLATVLWLLPASAMRDSLKPVTGNYIGYTGLWQSWGMFAPEPSSLNLYLSAVITYQDGSERTWSFPRMNQLDVVTRYYKERFRKYEEYAHLDAYQGIWPALARYVARTNNSDRANPQVHVRLTRNWWIVPPPADGDISHDPPHTWSQYDFFDMPILAADL